MAVMRQKNLFFFLRLFENCSTEVSFVESIEILRNVGCGVGRKRTRKTDFGDKTTKEKQVRVGFKIEAIIFIDFVAFVDLLPAFSFAYAYLTRLLVITDKFLKFQLYLFYIAF